MATRAFKAEMRRQIEASKPNKPRAWGVFTWHPDPRYPEAEAIKIYKSQKLAEKYARAHNLVERPIW